MRLWDPATGQTTSTLTGHTGWVHAVAWSPDGTRLATASDNGEVRLWDPTTGHTTTLTGHTDAVRHGTSGLLTDETAAGIAAGLVEVLSDEKRRAALTKGALARAAELSWENTATGMMRALAGEALKRR